MTLFNTGIPSAEEPVRSKSGGDIMVCTEKGVLPGSQYFFFDPSEALRSHYYCVLNCGHFYCEQGYRIRREGNTVPLMIYMVEGEFYLEYEDRQYTAHKGDILLINGQKPHAYFSGKYCEFIYIHFSGHSAKELTDFLIVQNGGPLFQAANHQTIYRLAFEPIARLYDGQTVTDVELSCCAYQCLCSLQDYDNMLRSAAQNPVIAESISFIRNHLSQDLSIRELAAHSSLSPYYYAHLFKKEMHISPIEYIARCKINLAKTILKTTQQTVGEIADSLGYSSCSSFINAFSSRVGISPLKFRNSDY